MTECYGRVLILDATVQHMDIDSYRKDIDKINEKNENDLKNGESNI